MASISSIAEKHMVAKAKGEGRKRGPRKLAAQKPLPKIFFEIAAGRERTEAAMHCKRGR